jgi:ATP-dependent helicase YprA (DUF1998 family)
VLNPVSKEEFENWKRDPITNALRHSIADSVTEGKEQLAFFDADQKLEDVRFKQGAIEFAMQILTWQPNEFEEDHQDV